MESVVGIGGLFFRAQDPDGLGKWYRSHLGVSLVPESYDVAPWQQEAGPTVFRPFPESIDYFGRPEKRWMVNFRVRDIVRTQLPGPAERAGARVQFDRKY